MPVRGTIKVHTNPMTLSLLQARAHRLVERAAATIDEAITIQQIPAPTFAEQERARYVAGRFRAIGLQEVEIDADSNVYGRLPGAKNGKALLVSAHTDTVFPADTDLTAQRDNDIVQGAGIADNSLGVAGLLALAEACATETPKRDIWFVANVCEEGLGNLKGMWAVTRRLQERIGAVVVLEGGAFGVVIHKGIGVVRYRITVTTPGGHAWSSFGTPSAIHELCKLGAAIATLDVPHEPRTTFNIGEIGGGTSINTVAATAHCLLDLRSESPHALEELQSQVQNLVVMHTKTPEVQLKVEEIGRRPAGGIEDNHPLVKIALAALESVGYDIPQSHITRAASTDANVPLSLNIPTVCIGLSVGHNAHRQDEYVEVAPLTKGLQQCFMTIMSAVLWLP